MIRREFLEALYGSILPKGASIYVLQVADENDKSSNRGAQVPYTRPLWFDDLAGLADYEFPDDVNVYFGVALRQHGTKTPILWTTLYADVDEEFTPPDTHPKPTVIIASGQGHHYYWALSRPFIDGEKEQVRIYLKGLVAYGADPAAAEPARLMRLPGTWNVKRKEPAACVVQEIHLGRRYETSDFVHFIRSSTEREQTPPKPLSLGQTPLDYIDAKFPPEMEYLRAAARLGLASIPPEQLAYWGDARKQTHSNLLLRVAIALALGGHTPEEAHYFIWRESPGLIRDKERRRPELVIIAIRKAYKWVTDQKARIVEGRTGTHLIEVKGCYHRIAADGEVGAAVCNFVAYPRAIFDLSGLEGGGYDVVLENTEGRRLAMRLPTLALNSTADWNRYVASPAFVWHGNRADLDRLHLKLNQPGLPHKRPVEVLGWYAGLDDRHWDYVLGSNTIYTRDGTTDKAPLWYAGNVEWNPPILPVKAWEREVREVLPALLTIHNPIVTWALLGWTLSTFVAPQIRAARRGEFSGLWLWGGTGAGKSKTMQTFLRLTSTPHLEIHAGSRIVGLKRAIAGSNTLPVFVDDPRQRLRRDETMDALYAVLRGVLNAEDDTLTDMSKRSITATVSRRLQAPTLVASESAIESDEAMEERYFYVPMRAAWASKATLARLDALLNRTVPLSALTHGFYRAMWDLDVAREWRLAFDLTAFLEDRGATTRRRSAIAQILVGLTVAMVIVPRLDLGADMFEIAGKLWDRAEAEVGRNLALPASQVFLRLVDGIDNLIATRRLIEGYDWKIRGRPAEPQVLFIVLNRLNHELSRGLDVTGLALTPTIVMQALHTHFRFAQLVNEPFPGEENARYCVELDLVALRRELGIAGGSWLYPPGSPV